MNPHTSLLSCLCPLKRSLSCKTSVHEKHHTLTEKRRAFKKICLIGTFSLCFSSCFVFRVYAGIRFTFSWHFTVCHERLQERKLPHYPLKTPPPPTLFNWDFPLFLIFLMAFKQFGITYLSTAITWTEREVKSLEEVGY